MILLARKAESYESIAKEITSSGGQAYGFSLDVGNSDATTSTFSQIKELMGDAKLAAAIFNASGRFIRKPFLDLSVDDYKTGFDISGVGLFNFAKATIPLLLESVSILEGTEKISPTLILTGATASLKGSAQCASFASGKFAMRALGQSLAREFGPKGVHIVHAIIDGVIDIPRTRDMVINGGAEDSKMSSAGIADGYWWLHNQGRSAWTHEIDMRPYVEKW